MYITYTREKAIDLLEKNLRFEIAAQGRGGFEHLKEALEHFFDTAVQEAVRQIIDELGQNVEDNLLRSERP